MISLKKKEFETGVRTRRRLALAACMRKTRTMYFFAEASGTSARCGKKKKADIPMGVVILSFFAKGPVREAPASLYLPIF